MRTPRYSGRVVAVLKINDELILIDTKRSPGGDIIIYRFGHSIQCIIGGGYCACKFEDGVLHNANLCAIKNYFKKHFPDKFEDIFRKEEENEHIYNSNNYFYSF